MNDKSRMWMGLLTMILAGVLYALDNEIVGSAFFIVGGLYFTSMSHGKE